MGLLLWLPLGARYVPEKTLPGEGLGQLYGSSCYNLRAPSESAKEQWFPQGVSLFPPLHHGNMSMYPFGGTPSWSQKNSE